MSPDSGVGIISVAGFRHWHYSGAWMMPDFGAAWFWTTDYYQIRAVRYQTCV
jgi:hypothetical protein